MKQASVRQLRNDFAQISEWLEKGESVQIVKRGKPFARIHPERRKETFVGACPSTKPLPDDLDEPLGMKWNAEQ